MLEKKLLPTRICTRLVCKQRFIIAQFVLWHTDTAQYNLYCGTMIHLSTVCTVALWYSSIFQYRISLKFIHYLHFPVSNFMRICSLSPFYSIEFHDNLFIISIFQYRIAWEFVHYLNFPVSNCMRICSLSQFSIIEFHENLFIISIFRYRISWKFVQ